MLYCELGHLDKPGETLIYDSLICPEQHERKAASGHDLDKLTQEKMSSCRSRDLSHLTLYALVVIPLILTVHRTDATATCSLPFIANPPTATAPRSLRRSNRQQPWTKFQP